MIWPTYRVRCRHADGRETVREFNSLFSADRYIYLVMTRGDAVECVIERVESQT